MKAAVAAGLLLTSVLPQAPAGAASICDLEPEDRPALQEPVELCGTTVITGSRSATMRVRVPSGAAVLEPTVNIAKPGRYGGVVFVEDVPAGEGGALLISRLGPTALCDEGGCSPSPVHVFSYSGGEWFDENERLGAGFLTAGTYTVHLLADSAPTEVSVRLAGRPGDITLRPETPADVAIQPLQGRVPQGPAPSLFWDGGSRSFHDPGMYIATAWAIFDPA
ncbi:MAG TPA: hypothetical protein VG602_08810, partial [Actinomycetota bacterium]|nr:hypothetical protein [Actinomycetota bacterium]